MLRGKILLTQAIRVQDAGVQACSGQGEMEAVPEKDVPIIAHAKYYMKKVLQIKFAYFRQFPCIL